MKALLTPLSWIAQLIILSLALTAMQGKASEHGPDNNIFDEAPSDPSASSPLYNLTAHPAGFGVGWVEPLTLFVQISTVDLCQNMSILEELQISQPEFLNSSLPIALLYLPPRGAGGGCGGGDGGDRPPGGKERGQGGNKGGGSKCPPPNGQGPPPNGQRPPTDGQGGGGGGGRPPTDGQGGGGGGGGGRPPTDGQGGVDGTPPPTNGTDAGTPLPTDAETTPPTDEQGDDGVNPDDNGMQGGNNSTSDEGIDDEGNQSSVNEGNDRRLKHPGGKKRGGSGMACEFHAMAQAAEKLFPTLQYLLVPGKELAPMRLYPIGSPDSKLALATVLDTDVEAIKAIIRNQTATGIPVYVDATSRYIHEARAPKEGGGPTTLAILGRVASSLSFFGSAFIMLSLFGTKKRRSTNFKSRFNRLLLGVCVADIFSSVGIFLGDWPSPTEPPGDYEGYLSPAKYTERMLGAAGNTATCTAQGFFIHLGLVGSTLFTTFVVVQTLLMVKYGFTRIMMRKAEIAFFSVGIGLPVITGTYCVVAELFNPIPAGYCWIHPTPNECLGKAAEEFPLVRDEYCENGGLRGGSRELTFVYQLVLALVWVMLAFVVVIASMVSLFFYVKRQENQVSRWSANAQEGRQQKKVFLKSCEYISVFLLVWTPTITAFAVGKGRTLHYVASFMLPLQGFLNAFIYMGVIEKFFEKLCCCLREKKNPAIKGSNYAMPSNASSQQTDPSSLGVTQSGPLSVQRIPPESQDSVLSTSAGMVAQSGPLSVQRVPPESQDSVLSTSVDMVGEMRTTTRTPANP